MYFGRVTAVMEAQWTRALELGVPVILDYGFWTRSSRNALRAKAALKVPLTLYALGLPDEEALWRVRQRNKEPEDKTFRLFRARFEPLEPDEGAVVVALKG